MNTCGMFDVEQHLFYDVRHGTLVDDLFQTTPFYDVRHGTHVDNLRQTTPCLRRSTWNTCGCFMLNDGVFYVKRRRVYVKRRHLLC